MNEQGTNHLSKDSAFSPREFIHKYLKYIPWIVISISLLLVLAYLKLRYSPNIYEVSSKLLIQNKGGGNRMQDLFMINESQNLNDEIEILKSTGLAKRVITNLGLQTSYYNTGNLKSYILHPSERPFTPEILKLNDSLQGFGMEIKYIDENTVMLNNGKNPLYLGQEFENAQGRFKLIKQSASYLTFESPLYTVTWQPIDDMAAGIAGGFSVSPINDFSNVLLIKYEVENPKLGKDIVNQLMKEYNISNVEDKRTTTFFTLEFIDERLDTLKQELSSVEQSLQNYREQNRAIDLDQQANISFSELSAATQTLTSQEVQIKILGYLTEYLDDKKNSNKTVPTSLGIQEPSLQVLITEYNEAQLKREIQLQTTTASNPIIRELDVNIAKLREQIRESLNNIRQSYIINRNNLMAKTKEFEANISSVPGKGRKMLEISREQKILEGLYSFLLQKKLETSISSASTISNSKVLEPAQYNMTPVKPNRRSLYLMAFVAGLGIPVAFIGLKEYLNDKISGRSDVERLSNAPILGEIGHSEQSDTLVVLKNNRKFISEQFRIIRTNLQYILNKTEKPIILITSTFSGEGKPFVSTNIGAVLALAGKKTVILEFDIRKPKIIAGLDLKGKSGITNYIVGTEVINDIIIPVPKVDNLFVIPCGPIPPNPGELLLDEKVAELFGYLRQNFDAVIIDSAPVGLVSDAIILSAYADATLYIMRQNYTLKKQLGLINDLYENKKLPKLSLILNDVKATGGYGGYYGNYGYGYSYGNSSEYFEKEDKKKRSFFRRFKK